MLGRARKGPLISSGKKPGTLGVGDCASQNFCMGVRDPQCKPKSYVAQIRHTINTYNSSCVIGVGIDSGLVAHWHLQWALVSR